MKSLGRLEVILFGVISCGFISIVSVSANANLNIKSHATTGLLPDPTAGAGHEPGSSATARSGSGWNSELENVLVLGAPVLFVPALLLALMYLFWAGSYSSYNYHHKYPHGFSYTGIGTMGGHYGSHSNQRPVFAANQNPHRHHQPQSQHQQPQHHGGQGHELGRLGVPAGGAAPMGISKRIAEMDNDGSMTHLLASI